MSEVPLYRARLGEGSRVQGLLANDRLRVGWLSGRGTTRAEDAQGTPTQRHVSPRILVYEDKNTHHTQVMNTHRALGSSGIGKAGECRGTSLIRNRHPLGPYSRTMPRLPWRS